MLEQPFNVLISSVSKKVPLVHCVREALRSLEISGKVFGADSNPQSIASYQVDGFWQMPPLEKLSVKELIAFCEQYQIKAIIPTRDGELPFYAEHQMALAERGIHCMVSSATAIATCIDKLLFYHMLQENKFPGIVTALQANIPLCDAYVVKERFGAGSKVIGLNLPPSEAHLHAVRLTSPIYQPFIEGEEYSVDLYIDRSGSCKGAVARRRECVVDGESQITATVSFPALETLCQKIAEHLQLYGHVIFQAICDRKKQLHLIECNPRFGGASTLSLAMGLDSFAWFFLECFQQPLPLFNRSSVEKRQVRYAQDLIFPANKEQRVLMK